MPHFSGFPAAAGAPFYNSTDPTTAGSPLMSLGTPIDAIDGRRFRWCKVGSGAALVAGNTIQAPAFLIDHTAMASAATALGATSITVTPGATAGAANLYAEGYAGISVGTLMLGYSYRVSGHLAITASVAFVINIEDPIQVALTTAGRVNLAPHPYQNVIQVPITTLTNRCVGVAPYIIAASQNGWLQTYGVASVLNKGTTGVGLAVGAPGSAAGACVVFAAATTEYLGDIMETGVDAICASVFLRLG